MSVYLLSANYFRSLCAQKEEEVKKFHSSYKGSHFPLFGSPEPFKPTGATYTQASSVFNKGAPTTVKVYRYLKDWTQLGGWGWSCVEECCSLSKELEVKSFEELQSSVKKPNPVPHWKGLGDDDL